MLFGHKATPPEAWATIKFDWEDGDQRAGDHRPAFRFLPSRALAVGVHGLFHRHGAMLLLWAMCFLPTLVVVAAVVWQADRLMPAMANGTPAPFADWVKKGATSAWMAGFLIAVAWACAIVHRAAMAHVVRDRLRQQRGSWVVALGEAVLHRRVVALMGLAVAQIAFYGVVIGMVWLLARWLVPGFGAMVPGVVVEVVLISLLVVPVLGLTVASPVAAMEGGSSARVLLRALRFGRVAPLRLVGLALLLGMIGLGAATALQPVIVVATAWVAVLVGPGTAYMLHWAVLGWLLASAMILTAAAHAGAYFDLRQERENMDLAAPDGAGRD